MNEEPAISVDMFAQAPRSQRRETVLALAVIVVVGIFFGLPSLPEPFGVDQGIYGYIAERLLDGAVGYRDVFDHKPPGIHAAYATAFSVFGHKMWSVRLLDLLAAVATGSALFLFGVRWIGLRAGLLAGSLYVAYYMAAFDWMSRAQPEAGINLMFAGALALAAGPRTWWRSPAAGFALGIGFWFKPTIVALAPVWIMVLACRPLGEPPDRWKQFRLDLFLAISGAFVFGIMVILLYVVKGAFSEFYEAVFRFNMRYHNRLQLLREWRQIGQAILFIIRPLFALALLLVLAIGIAGVQRRRRPAILGVAWLLLAFATVFWQASTAKSHYALVLPPMVFLASLGLDGAIETMKTITGRQARWRGALLSAVVAGCCLVLLNLYGLSADRWAKFIALAGGDLPREKYYATFWLKGAPGRGGYSVEDLRQIAAYLEEQTTPDQTIFVWGFRPLIAYLAHRRMPTRFVFRYPLTRTNDPRWWAEFLSDLERERPAFFVVVLDDRGRYHPETSKEALESNAALSLFLHSRYELDRTMTDFEIYRLRKTNN